ncbi:ATP-binding protein [Alcaligenaceae bacterium C4P045]|nr:ATP-binding protein [Alcaligenaceae bacterium C4P045]
MEPIRVPGAVQPHGAVVLVEPTALRVLSASVNCADLLGHCAAVGDRLHVGDDAAEAQLVLDAVAAWAHSDDVHFVRAIAFNGHNFQLAVHRTPQGLLCEFELVQPCDTETLEALYPRMRSFLDNLEPESGIEAIAGRAAEEIRGITGYNRVLVYRFDDDGHGTVIAESGDGTLPTFLDHRFPASDIPPQARELYISNRVRLISDAAYQPVPLAPAAIDGAPIDLSAANLRSVSPVHLEYMRNMGTMASMSVSLVIDGKLWGLISCHNAQARAVGPQVRAACEFLGRIVAQQIGATYRVLENAQRLASKRIETELVAKLSRASSLQIGMTETPELWLRLANAHGVAIVDQGRIDVVGETPSLAQIADIVDWLGRQPIERPLATDHLAALLPVAETFADKASGLIAVPISQLHASFILWFRPEVVRTVKWSGDPRKPVDPGSGRLHPRKSFAAWQEQLRQRSVPWRESEIEAVADLRNALISFVLLRAEERAEMTDELERSNAELESFSYSVSHDLRAPFRHIAGFAELLKRRATGLDETSQHYLSNIVAAAITAGTLVDDLLRFSHLGRAALSHGEVDMNKLVDEARQTIAFANKDRLIDWRIDRLPPAWGDQNYLRQTLFNLMDNAAKYTRRAEPAVIRITGERRDDETVYTVSDNGVGFEMEYVGKLFGVFQRLHKPEDFEGTGIGLALSKRIVEKHGGRIEAHGKINQGAQFIFALPNKQQST